MFFYMVHDSVITELPKFDLKVIVAATEQAALDTVRNGYEKGKTITVRKMGALSVLDFARISKLQDAMDMTKNEFVEHLLSVSSRWITNKRDRDHFLRILTRIKDVQPTSKIRSTKVGQA